MADFKIEPTEKGLAYWTSRPFIGADLRQQLAGASVLVVPQEGFRDNKDPMFPDGTEELLAFLKDVIPADVGVDICIEDHDYRELALHSDLIILAALVVRDIACNLVASGIYDYLKARLGSRAKTTNVRFQMTIEHESEHERRAARISYEGPVEGFQETLQKAIAAAKEPGARAEIPIQRDLPGRKQLTREHP